MKLLIIVKKIFKKQCNQKTKRAMQELENLEDLEIFNTVDQVFKSLERQGSVMVDVDAFKRDIPKQLTYQLQSIFNRLGIDFILRIEDFILAELVTKYLENLLWMRYEGERLRGDDKIDIIDRNLS